MQTSENVYPVLSLIFLIDYSTEKHNENRSIHFSSINIDNQPTLGKEQRK